jgi:hypothetical protein
MDVVRLADSRFCKLFCSVHIALQNVVSASYLVLIIIALLSSDDRPTDVPDSFDRLHYSRNEVGVIDLFHSPGPTRHDPAAVAWISLSSTIEIGLAYIIARIRPCKGSSASVAEPDMRSKRSSSRP